MRSQYISLWTQFAKEKARIWRIKVELGDSSQIDAANMKDVPIPFSTISEIVSTETEYLKTKESDYEREKAFLQHGVREGDDQIKVLPSQQKAEEEGYQTDLDELQKVNDLVGKGALVSPRVTDARRAVLNSATRKLQTQAQLMQVRTQKDEFKRKLEKLDDQRRIDLLRELQDASVALSETRGKLQSVGEKLQYTAMVRSQLVRGAGDEAEIAIIRKGKKGEERIVADEDAELQPGDTVEVALHYQDAPDIALREESTSKTQPKTQSERSEPMRPGQFTRASGGFGEGCRNSLETKRRREPSHATQAECAGARRGSDGDCARIVSAAMIAVVLAGLVRLLRLNSGYAAAVARRPNHGLTPGRARLDDT